MLVSLLAVAIAACTAAAPAAQSPVPSTPVTSGVIVPATSSMPSATPASEPTAPPSSAAPTPFGAPTASPGPTSAPTKLVTPTPKTPPAATVEPTRGPTPRPTTGVGQVSAPPAHTTNPSPTATSAPPSGGPQDGTITLADNGRTLTLAIGARVLLNLGSGFDWTVSPTDESVLARVRNITVIRGAQGVYEAVGTGQTEVSATGDPPCRRSTPACGAPSILFRVVIVVR